MIPFRVWIMGGALFAATTVGLGIGWMGRSQLATIRIARCEKAIGEGETAGKCWTEIHNALKARALNAAETTIEYRDRQVPVYIDRTTVLRERAQQQAQAVEQLRSVENTDACPVDPVFESRRRQLLDRQGAADSEPNTSEVPG